MHVCVSIRSAHQILTHLVNVNITMDMVSEATKQVLAEVAMEIGLPPNDGPLGYNLFAFVKKSVVDLIR